MTTIAKRENQDLKALAKENGELSKTNNLLEYRGNYAIINVNGPIFRYANLFTEISGATSTDDISQAIGEAETSTASGVIFRFDTPGGDATEISALAEMINDCKLPTIAYVGAMAASAGYWMASACDDIVICSTGMVGSIGTVATIDISEDDDQTIEIVSSQSPYKRLDPQSEEGQESIQAMVDKMSQVFIEDVAKYRGVSVEHVLTYFGKGGLVIGAEAVTAKMADRIGSFEGLFLTTTSGAIKMSDEKIVAEAQPEVSAEVEPLTVELLAEQHADLYAQVIEKGFKAGAEHERNRIKAVKDQMINGFESQIESMMFDGETTAEQAAVAILAEVKKSNENILSSVAQVQAPIADEPGQSSDPIQRDWDKNVNGCRDDFGNIDHYRAYTAGVSKGQIRRLAK